MEIPHSVTRWMAAELRIMRREIDLLKLQRLLKAHAREAIAEGTQSFDYKSASFGSAIQGMPWVLKLGDHLQFENITPVEAKSCENMQRPEYTSTNPAQEYVSFEECAVARLLGFEFGIRNPGSVRGHQE